VKYKENNADILNEVNNPDANLRLTCKIIGYANKLLEKEEIKETDD